MAESCRVERPWIGRPTVHTAASELQHPGRFLREAAGDLRRSLAPAWQLFRRNMQVRYRRAGLGYLWLLLPTAGTTLVWVYVQSRRIIDVAPTDVPYPVYVLTGTILWQVFADASIRSCSGAIPPSTRACGGSSRGTSRRRQSRGGRSTRSARPSVCCGRSREHRLLFAFTGGSGAWPGMGRSLYRESAVFRVYYHASPEQLEVYEVDDLFYTRYVYARARRGCRASA